MDLVTIFGRESENKIENDKYDAIVQKTVDNDCTLKFPVKLDFYFK